MIVLYIIAGIILLFAILLSFNVSVRVIFNSSAKEETNVYVKIGFYKIHIIPEKPKKEKKVKEIKKKPEKKKPKPEKPEKIEEKKPKEKKKYTISEIFDLIKDIGAVLLKRFKKHFRVKIYSLNVLLAAEEAEKTALLYGAAVQSAYYLYEFLDRNFKIRKKKNCVKIIPDFSKIKTAFDVDIKFYMRLSHMFGLGLASLFKFLSFRNHSGKVVKAETEVEVEKKVEETKI